jgi:putative ABC transport system permease protein
MSAAVRERPVSRRATGGGVPAWRAVIRWAVRLLRREWRQQFLILALITAAVAATVLASTVATDTPAPVAGLLGTAQDAAALSGPPAKISAGVRELESRYGTTDVIENESIQISGTLDTFDLRAQDPRGPFGGPMVSLVSGEYPAAADQIAVTSDVAADFKLTAGSSWTVAGKTWKVTGFVSNPQSRDRSPNRTTSRCFSTLRARQRPVSGRAPGSTSRPLRRLLTATRSTPRRSRSRPPSSACC